MEFTKLRLTGFKSFVDPTELSIARGLTGVVGPNGCGKSNLLEALRWVMGENRPTAMRGAGMEDVIFAGASSRPARNYAEVTLTIDNTERRAPAAFNTADQIEVIRRITRDAGSVFKTNGREARARDVQMLFADASTGSHSPALVRQGQISELINARPKARRRILEEAAGISGLYQRRHEAELKLSGTEQNLTRVADVLDQLDQQLASLSRQARQAARYREISEGLRQAEGLLLYLRWREADDERERARAALTEATRAAAAAQGATGIKARVREEAEAAIPPLREEEAIAAAVLQRLSVEREQLAEQEARARQTIAELTSRLTQIGRDREREQGLNRDAGETLERLTWESGQLTKAAEGHADTLAAMQEAARSAAESLQEQEANLDRLSEESARLAARHQTVARRLEDADRTLARTRKDAEEARASLAAVDAERDTAAAAATHAGDGLVTAQEHQIAAEEALSAAEAARAGAQSAESERRAAFSVADGEANALRAEVSGLERLLARDAGKGDQLLDRVRAAPGFEAALGAALAEDLRAPETDGATGWALLPPYDETAPLPGGAEPLAARVTAPPVLARRLAQTGIVARADGAALQAALLPGQRLVSPEGDLWRWDGLRTGADDTPSAAALRLQQQNRLDALSADLATAEAAAAEARDAHEEAREELEAATAADAQARQDRRAADEAVTAATRALNRAEAEVERLAGRHDTLTLALKRREEEAALAATERADAEAAQAELGPLEDARDAVEAAKTLVEGARLSMLTARANADEIRREGEARERRLRDIARESATWTTRLQNAEKRVADLDARQEQAEEALEEATGRPEEIAAQRETLAANFEAAEARRRRAADTLAAGENALRTAVEEERAAERDASAARELRARAEAMCESADARVEEAAARIAEETEESPEALLERLGVAPDALPSPEECELDAARLRRQREALGAVNLRAEEDTREVSAERDTLGREKSDLEEAIVKLRQGISELNREGRQRLLAAFDVVNRNFATLFRHLFGGGEANLVLVESEDPLDAGLEIMCMPPGKKLATLSLLSGGEQTLTALSLIFAVFLANPAPICVLDEVDAPLDDANVTRFCDLLDEMTRQTSTRFLIITHHAVTMSRMDRLFGVTMAERGVSQLVSVDLARAEALVDG
ncbi:chromosome segregation protein SMC [Oceanicella sp. SM1341]|uniref:chromosome segregation protein SMC n=1 Tax=Oceanicella sp. SM1341 TaxID=1548889 RepID=UPI000E4728C5|nr:chromosome segregation protein SMC [Oceanicella sp. SM1341]